MRGLTKRLAGLLAVGMTVLTLACDTGSWVAKAGPYTLEVDEFAETLAGWRYLRVRDIEAERWAHRWVEWTLFVDRVAQGDSLLDSATVYAAVWPEVHEMLFRAFQEQVLADSVPMSPEIVDRAFAQGDYRLIYHILLRPPPGSDATATRAVQREVEAMRERLLAGGSWEVENERNRDDWAKVRGGSLGVVTRGMMLPAFDSVAFALAPGEISGVFETEYGFHVAKRPTLADVREEFTQGYRDLRVAELDAAFQLGLPERYQLEYADDVMAIVRAAAREPLKAMTSDDVIATFANRRFTAEDLIRRLRMEPPDLRYEMQTESDDAIQERLDRLLQRELVVQAARDAGVTLTPAQDAELKFGHKQNMAEVIENMELDRFLVDGASPAERREQVQAAVRDHIAKTASVERVPRFVPTYLADVLRHETSWRVSERGIAAVVERATQLRAERETRPPEP